MLRRLAAWLVGGLLLAIPGTLAAQAADSGSDSLFWQGQLDTARRHPSNPARMQAALLAVQQRALVARKPKWAIRTQFALAYLLMGEGKLRQSLELFQLGGRAARHLGDSALVAEALVGISLPYEWSGDFAHAELKLYRARLAARDSLTMHLVAIRTAAYKARRKQWAEAEAWLARARRIAMSQPDGRIHATTDWATGLIRQSQGQPEAALAAFQASLHHAGAMLPEEMLRAQQAAVVCLETLKRYPELVGLTYSAMAMAGSANDEAALLDLQVRRALAWKAMGRADSTRRILEQAIRYGPVPAALWRPMNRAATELANLVEDKEPRLAVRLMRLHLALEDSLTERQAARNREMAEFRFANTRREQDLALIDKERQLVDARGNLLVGLVMGIILITLFVAWRWRAQSQSNVELKRQHRALAHANDEINRQMRLLDEQAAALQQANSEKDEVIGIAAHDLKNPIAAIKIFATLLRESAHALTPQQIEEFAGKIVQSSDQMMDIVTKLLDINQIEQGRLALSLEPVDAGMLADQVVSMYLDRAEQKDIHLQFETSEDLPLVTVDPRRMLQVLDNLLSNALKFSPRGSTVDLRVVAQGDFVRFEVQDEGPGIQPHERDRLFQKFAKLSARPTGGESSSGLGLSIVHKLVSLMGGTVEVESEPGAGAMFAVVFRGQPTLVAASPVVA